MTALPGLRALGLFLVTLLLGLSPPAFAQAITYEYDALGRLILVASPEGVARYEYDAVGNLLRIVTRRYSETPDPVAILMMSPDRGPVGTEVHLYGKGFGETPAANQVAFNGTPAPVTAASSSRLVTSVPPGATTGPITVTAPGGSASSPDPFTVTQQLAVVPPQADVALGGLLDFQATRDGAPLTSGVTWQVNGIEGGTAQLGTITPAGTYTAPTTMPPLQPVSIEALLTADPTQVATARVRISQQPGGLRAAAPVSVTGAADAPALAGSAPVSVTGAAATLTPMASPPVSVTVAAGTALAGSGPLSVTRTPVILTVSPATAPPGTAALALTLTGANLRGEGATTLQVLRTGQADATVTASGIAPAPDGTNLTATLTIAGSAPLGLRVLQVSNSLGSSTGFDLGTNTFTVTAP